MNSSLSNFLPSSQLLLAPCWRTASGAVISRRTFLDGQAELQARSICKNNSCLGYTTCPATPIPSRRAHPPSPSQRLIGPLYLHSFPASLHEPTHRDPKKRLAQPGLLLKTAYLRLTSTECWERTTTTSSPRKVASSRARRTLRCDSSSSQLVRIRLCAASLMRFTTQGYRAPSSSDIQNGRGRGPSFRRKRWLASGPGFHKGHSPAWGRPT